MSTEPNAVTVTSGPALLLDVIRQAAADPTVDTNKMSALLEMRRELQAEQNRIEFDAALSRVQEQIGPVSKRGTIPLKGASIRFAIFEDIQSVVKPILRQEGFTTTYDEEIVESVKRVTCTLSRNGHSRSVSTYVPVKDSHASRSEAQAMVSAQSYGRRRALINILDIEMQGEDDDGAGGSQPITKAQADQIEMDLDELSGNKQKFLALLGVETFAAITDRQMAQVRHNLELKRKQTRGK
jgi:hypothetical protein